MIAEADKKYLSVGYKQTMKAISEDEAKTVYIACDSEEKMYNSVNNLAKEKNLEIFYADTMRELGKMCFIDKGASCAVIKKHS